jgi:curved DNA-binding protein CbpA
VGLRKKKATRPKSTKTPRRVGELREQIAAALANGAATATFEETTEVPRDAIPTTGAIEPLILDALRGLEDNERVRGILGDLDQRLVTTAALAKQKRTLTLTEGYLLSRVDGVLSTREILQLVPLQSDEAETTLAALLLTGRLKQEEPEPRPKRSDTPRTVPDQSLATGEAHEPDEEVEEEDAPTAPTRVMDADDDAAPATDEEAASPSASQSEDLEAEEPAPTEPATPQETPSAATSKPDDEESEEPPPLEPVPATPEQDAERQEILEVFQSLPFITHYEVFGVERRCSEADLKKAQVALVKRYHPDMRREAHLVDLHDVLEAIFIRVGEAWDVLGNPKSRAAYEQELGRAPRRKETEAKETAEEEQAARPQEQAARPQEQAARPQEQAARPQEQAARPQEQAAWPQGPVPDERLRQAQLLLGTGRYWDAIQMLETLMPQFDSQEHQHEARILLARAYSRNPKWVHRAVETLQEVLAEDPKNANAYYELGMVYKTGGLATRAEGMFQKALDANPRHKQALAELAAKEKEPASGGLLRRLFGRGG